MLTVILNDRSTVSVQLNHLQNDGSRLVRFQGLGGYVERMPAGWELTVNFLETLYQVLKQERRETFLEGIRKAAAAGWTVNAATLKQAYIEFSNS